MTCAWHEALIPIRLDRQSLSFLSLLSGITHVCICPHIIMEKKCANLKSLGNVNKISLFTWACHQDQATCEVRSGQNSLSHEIPASEEDEFDSIASDQMTFVFFKTTDYSRVIWRLLVDKIMDLLTTPALGSCQSPNLVQHEKQF